ncbi:cGMP-dependent 3',5'-cyclic phosphodiesterase-like [Diorhabda carinulata]|uniref:cGMP-dependent 3',5'-cyclic phosphodiesterase-like n=1 Tax=Diorhabda carinulata TaxID=1163345 RepID=UPI0025A2F13B|nr:cGMP-dependent 3',5'-cyclic phosphodiesterase-like [Diorhabda carinulata]
MTQPLANQHLFLPSPYCKSYVNPNKDVIIYKDENPLKKIVIANPGKILQLCENLTDSHTKYLEAKMNIYFKAETGARAVFFINLFDIPNKACIQVIQVQILEQPITSCLCEDTINNILIYKHSVLKCAEKLDAKIQRMIEEATSDETEAQIVIVPVISKEIRTNLPKKLIPCPVYLICFVEPLSDAYLVRTLVDETMMYCLTPLLNTRYYEEEKQLKIRCQNLLSVTRKLFSELENINELLRTVIREVTRLTNSEKCCLFLLDPDHVNIVAKVFDGVNPIDKKTLVRIAKDQGIAGHVAATGKTLIIKNAYKHPLFYKDRDEIAGFKTRNILCFPLRDENGVIGVAQLYNKIDGNYDYFDEQITNAFSIFCGLSIRHSLLYKKVEDSQSKCQLSNRLMFHYFQIKDQDIADILLCEGYHNVKDFDSFSFSARKVIYTEIPCYILKIFHNLKLCEEYKIKDEVFVRFLLYVKRGYKDLPYHNWIHGFACTHFAYLAVKHFRLVEKGYLSKLECLAYLISCLCHDIEHKGTTNSCEPQTNCLLANLYSSRSSVMERYQLSQTLRILNLDGCNILENINIADYSKCIDLMKNMILATDLATHYRIHSRQLVMATEGFNYKNPEHRFFLCSLLMTCADLSEHAKDWMETKSVAQLYHAEFFDDLSDKLIVNRDDMNGDKEKLSMPHYMFEFLTDCCLCVFRILSKMFPAAECLVEAVLRNVTCWDVAKGVFDALCLDGGTSYEILISDAFEDGVQKALVDLTVEDENSIQN